MMIKEEYIINDEYGNIIALLDYEYTDRQDYILNSFKNSKKILNKYQREEIIINTKEDGY